VQASGRFERTIEPEQAPFDRWVAGDEAAISASAKRGFELFNGKGLCFACHGGWRFTDDKFTTSGHDHRPRARVTLKDDPQMQFAFQDSDAALGRAGPPYMNNGSAVNARGRGPALRKGWNRPAKPLAAAAAIRLNDQNGATSFAFMERSGRRQRRDIDHDPEKWKPVSEKIMLKRNV